MNRRRQVFAAFGAVAGLFGVPACAMFTSKVNTPPPAVNPGSGADADSLDPTALTGSVLVRILLADRKVSALSDVIDRIDVTVTGSRIPEPLTGTVTSSQIASGEASVTIGRIPPGDATLAAYVKDAKGNVIATATSMVAIVAGKQSVVNLDISVPLFGSISTTISVAGADSASGSVVTPHEAFPAVSGEYGVLQVGSRYVGATTCKLCHPAIFDVFKTTGHWNPREATGNRPGTDIENFSGFLDKKTGSNPYLANNSCRTCHVVGDGSTYDPVARKVVQKSIFLSDGVTPAGFDFSKPWNDEYNKKFVGIQCESCHGPGANHVAASNAIDRRNSIVRIPSYKKTCAACHNKDINREWPATGATDADVNAGGGGAYPPHPQYLVFAQNGGFHYGNTVPQSAHGAKLGNGCINCHVAGQSPANHVLYLEESWDTHIGNCQKCHGSGFTPEMVKASQAQTRLGLESLKKVMIEYRKAFCQEVAATSSASPVRNSTASADIADLTKFCSQWDDSPAVVKEAGEASHSNAVKVISSDPGTWSPHQTAYNRAYWNKSLIEKDVSFGAHSPIYIQSLIRFSYNDLLKDLPSSASYSVLGIK